MTLFCFLLASCIPDLRVEAGSLDTPMVEDQKKKKKGKGKQQNCALTKCSGNEQSSKITDHIQPTQFHPNTSEKTSSHQNPPWQRLTSEMRLLQPPYCNKVSQSLKCYVIKDLKYHWRLIKGPRHLYISERNETSCPLLLLKWYKKNTVKIPVIC